jgi:hypothetical protein
VDSPSCGSPDGWGGAFRLPRRRGRGRRLPRTAGLADRLPGDELEARAESLHTFVDGLTLQGATFAEQMPPARQRRLLRERLAALRSGEPEGHL